MAQITGSSSADVLAGTSTSDIFAGFSGHDTFLLSLSSSGQTDVILDFGATYFGGAITPQQEVNSFSSTGVAPAATSTASGTMTGWLNRAQTDFFFAASITGLDLGGQTAQTSDNVTAAHFHRAPAGAAGGVVFGFIGAPNNETGGETVVNASAGTVTGSWDAREGNNTTLAAQAAGLLNNEIYINFHTSTFPGGEIRGQAIRLDQGRDVIDLRQTGFGDFATLQLFMTEVNGSAQINLTWNGQANTLILQGVPLARLSSADFLFADTNGRSGFGTSGDDVLVGGSGSDFLYGEDGNDRIVAGEGHDWAEGREGNDTIQGLTGNDTLSGGFGADDVNGNIGEDQVYGDQGADTVRGGQNNDTLFGGAGDDPHVNGNLGNDLVYGGDGNDTVYGGQNNDTLHGEAGNDWLSGDLGSDHLYGGAGADRYILRAGGGDDWAVGFNAAEGDRIMITTGTNYSVSSHAGQVLITLNAGASIGLAGVASSSFDSSWIVFG